VEYFTCSNKNYAILQSGRTKAENVSKQGLSDVYEFQNTVSNVYIYAYEFQYKVWKCFHICYKFQYTAWKCFHEFQVHYEEMTIPTNTKLFCEISSSHGGEYDVQNCLLGYTELSYFI
jgi:hypothetical protein